MKLIYPVLFQVFWTLVVLAIMFRARRAAYRGGEVTIPDVAVSGEKWPEKAKLAANNFSNQFETPLLFFVLAGIAVHIGATDWIMVGLAWAFVVTRIVHTLVHTGSNAIGLRVRAFGLGVLMLLFMLVRIVIRLF